MNHLAGPLDCSHLSLKKSTLALRFREATPKDVAFMESLLENEARNLSGVYASETFLPQRDHRNPIMKRTSRKGENCIYQLN